MESVSKSYLKTHMLRLFRKLEDEGDELIVTDHNRPVLRIAPVGRRSSVADAFGAFQGKVVYHEDLDAPTAAEWADL
jgi:antitoxin (DNA-binding transcriptional repressor) of toxin-antitoxin stability system